MWSLAVLQGDRISGTISKAMHGLFSGARQKWPLNEVAYIDEVAVRQGFTVLQLDNSNKHCA